MTADRVCKMKSLRGRLVKSLLVRNMMRKMFDPSLHSVAQIRLFAEKMGGRIKISRKSEIERIDLDGVGAEWLGHADEGKGGKRVILYFHSGGFCLGLGNNHRQFALALSKSCGVRVLALDYRLAPEYRYPAANQDCLSSYKWLLRQGYRADDIIVGGDSAGAGLALMTLLKIKALALPMPGAVFLLSLMGGDLKEYDGESYTTRKISDPLNSKEIIMKYGELYLGTSVVEPPVTQDLTGFPEMFIQIGGDEVLLSDSMLLAHNAKNAGVDVTLEVYEGMWHVFQGFFTIVPEAKKAFESLASYIRMHLDKGTPDNCHGVFQKNYIPENNR